jgi:DnaJ family protein C protein 2
VPELGNEKSTKKDVEDFYEFWFNFDSWRSFEYQDEDIPDDNEHRHQRRHVEKKNQNARKKKKTEDIARLRKLVDDVLALDERIKKFRKEEQEQKHKKRNDLQAEAKRVADAQAKAKEEEEKAKKDAEEAAKVEKESLKKAKDAAKNATKKNKRVVRNAAKDANYFHAAGGDAPPKQIDAALNDVDTLLAKIDPEELAAIVEKLSLDDTKGAEKVQAVFKEEVSRLTSEGKLSENEVTTLRG